MPADGPPLPRSDRPFAWWGTGRVPRRLLGLGDLVADGTVDPWRAALLWTLVARRTRLVVVAERGRAGKTTLLTALAALLPVGIRRIYLRGGYEPFAFLDDPAVVPERSVLLVNEISPHLPSYLWGPPLRRALRASQGGFGLLATAHAAGAEGFIALLAGEPLRVPPAEATAFAAVATLRPVPAADRHHLTAIQGLVSTARGGIEVVALDDAAALRAAADRWPAAIAPSETIGAIGEEELARRMAALRENPASLRPPPPPRWPDIA